MDPRCGNTINYEMKIKGSGKKFRAISHESDTVLLERRKGHGVRVKG